MSPWLADAVRIFLGTITVPNTSATYAAALDRPVADFGADTNVALLVGDPLVRLRARPAPSDTSKALPRRRVGQILGSDAPLRERVLWHLLHESSARAEEVLMLDVAELDAVNRCAVVIRKGGARELIAWQTGTARLLPRMLGGRKSGPLLLTDRKTRPSVATNDVDPVTGRARLS
ncbi:hypothetical protein [Nocardia terpenica]|uniref:hypothetical protein n=1 Tax=Nocardia terpenica TaxID=455432 RepID=UPI002FE16983